MHLNHLYFTCEKNLEFENRKLFPTEVTTRSLDDVKRHYLGNQSEPTLDMYPCLVIMYSSGFAAYLVSMNVHQMFLSKNSLLFTFLFVVSKTREEVLLRGILFSRRSHAAWSWFTFDRRKGTLYLPVQTRTQQKFRMIKSKGMYRLPLPASKDYVCVF